MTSLALAAAMMSMDVTPRFQPERLLGVRPAMMDVRLSRFGVANETARQRGLQARILWVDATANLDRVNTEEKVRAMVQRTASAGFNVLVFDVKPIIGRSMYPSEVMDRLTFWRTARMPEDFDPMPYFLDECRKQGIELFVSLNAFSEGHSMAVTDRANFGDPGWGYGKKELQTMQYEAFPYVAFLGGELDVELTRDPGRWTKPLAVYSRWPEGAQAGVVMNVRGRVVATGVGAPIGRDQFVLVGQEDGLAYVNSLTVGREVSFSSRAMFRPIEENQTQIPLMMNPLHPEVQERQFAVLRELLTKYPVDGVLYDDRLRFGGIDSDFSPLMRRGFEARIGRPVRWPDEVFEFVFQPDLTRGIKPGPLWDAWLTYRAEVMGDFTREARALVKSMRPQAQFGIYAGSTFGDYPRVGVNYGAQTVEAGFPFMTRAYQRAGFARDLDLLITGCYYRFGTIYEAMQLARPTGHSVEAAAIMSNRIADDQTWTYAGIMLSFYDGNPEGLETALQAAVGATQGVMVFDYSHNIDQFWPTFERAFRQRTQSPHAVPGLIDLVRQRRIEREKAGMRVPPFPFFEGASGAGW